MFHKINDRVRWIERLPELKERVVYFTWMTGEAEITISRWGTYSDSNSIMDDYFTDCANPRKTELAALGLIDRDLYRQVTGIMDYLESEGYRE